MLIANELRIKKQRRTTTQVFVDIINVTRSGEIISKIILKAQINSNDVYPHVNFLQKMGLIEKVSTKEGILFRATDTAIRVLPLLTAFASYRTEDFRNVL